MSSTNIEKNLNILAPACTGQPPVLQICPQQIPPSFPPCLAKSDPSCGTSPASLATIYDTTSAPGANCGNRSAGINGSCLPAPFALWIRDTTYLYLAIQTWGQMLYGYPHLFKPGIDQGSATDVYKELASQESSTSPQESWYKYTIGNWVRTGYSENDFINGYIKADPWFFQQNIITNQSSLWQSVDYNDQCYLVGESPLVEPKCLQTNCASLLKLPVCQTCTEGGKTTFKLTLHLSQYMFDQLNADEFSPDLIVKYINFFLGLENSCSGPVCGGLFGSPSLKTQDTVGLAPTTIGPDIEGSDGWTVQIKLPTVPVGKFPQGQTVNIMLLNTPRKDAKIAGKETMKKFDKIHTPINIYSIVNHDLEDYLDGTANPEVVRITQQIPPIKKPPQKADLRDWFACTYPLTVEITQFTPMLVVYFIMNSNKSTNKFKDFLYSFKAADIPGKLNPNALVGSSLSLTNFLFLDPTVVSGSLPLSCEFKNVNTGNILTNEQKDIIIRACKNIYTPPTKFQKVGVQVTKFIDASSSAEGSVSNYIANSFSGTHGQGICRCLQSSIVPSRVYQDEHFPYLQGLCFDNECQTLRDLWYGPDKYKEACQGYCPQIYDWLHDSTDPASRETQQKFMLQPFKTICGKNYNPDNLTFLGDPVRISIVLSAVVLLTLTTLITNSWVSTFFKKTFLFLISSIIIGGVATFCCIELQGTAVCPEIAGKVVDSICAGKITGKTIPQEYCKEVKGCECYFKHEGLCPNCTECELGFCLTKENPECTGQNRPAPRKSQIVTKRHINTLGVGIGVTLSVCVPLITYLFMRRHYPSIPRKYLIIISVILIGGILAATFVPPTSIETAQVREYDSLIAPGQIEPSPDKDIVTDRGKMALTGFTAFLGIILILIGIFLIYTFITRKKPSQSNKRFEYGIIATGIIIILIIAISLGVIFAKKPPPKMPTIKYGPSTPPPESLFVYVLKLNKVMPLSSSDKSWCINDFVHSLSPNIRISSLEDLEKAMPNGIKQLNAIGNFFGANQYQYIYCYPSKGQWKYDNGKPLPQPAKIIWGPGDPNTCLDQCKTDICDKYKKGIPTTQTQVSSCPSSSIVAANCGNVPIIDTTTSDSWQYVFITSDLGSFVDLINKQSSKPNPFKFTCSGSTTSFTLSNDITPGGENSPPKIFNQSSPMPLPLNACPTPIHLQPAPAP